MLVLFLLLVAFPFVSWYYLKQGVNYRKQALAELSEKTPFPSSIIPQDKLLRRTSIISLTSDSVLVSKIYDQFKDALSFQMVVDSMMQLNDTVSVLKWSFTEQQLASFTNIDFLLLDVDGNIRHRYIHGTSYEGDLVKHVATILPVNDKKK